MEGCRSSSPNDTGDSGVEGDATLARNRAIDFARHLGYEVTATDRETAPEGSQDWEEATQARLLIQQFREQQLPPEWRGVFDLRFLHQLPQREAAHRLKIHRRRASSLITSVLTPLLLELVAGRRRKPLLRRHLFQKRGHGGERTFGKRRLTLPASPAGRERLNLRYRVRLAVRR